LGEIGLWNAEAESWSPECCSGVWNVGRRKQAWKAHCALSDNRRASRRRVKQLLVGYCHVGPDGPGRRCVAYKLCRNGL
jgi:hypothetical protein